MTYEAERELMMFALAGDANACALFELLARASQVFDDYYDRDKPVARDALMEAVLTVSVDVWRNPFALRFPYDVAEIIETAFTFWLQANDIEACARQHKHTDIAVSKRLLSISYITRSTLTDALIKLARLVGGRAHERAVALKVRELIYGDNEPFTDYLSEQLGESYVRGRGKTGNDGAGNADPANGAGADQGLAAELPAAGKPGDSRH